MKRLLLLGLFALAGFLNYGLFAENPAKELFNSMGGLSASEIDSLYSNMIVNGPKPSYPLFSMGLNGFHSLLEEGKILNARYLTLIDFTLSSKERRLWVIDLENDSIVHHSLVAHGKNTGEEYAVEFSNKPKSNMSNIVPPSHSLSSNRWMEKSFLIVH